MLNMPNIDIVLALEVSLARGCRVVPKVTAIELDIVSLFNAIMSISKLSVITLLCVVSIAIDIESIKTKAIGISLKLDVLLAARG